MNSNYSMGETTEGKPLDLLNGVNKQGYIMKNNTEIG